MIKYAPLLCMIWMCSLLFTACEDDAKNTPGASDLTGRWELVKGYRNDQETETLTGTYFVFSEDQTLQTNLPIGADAPTPFTLEKDKVILKSNPPITFSVKSATDSTLDIILETRGIEFEMLLQKRDSVEAPSEWPGTEGPENLNDSE